MVLSAWLPDGRYLPWGPIGPLTIRGWGGMWFWDPVRIFGCAVASRYCALLRRREEKREALRIGPYCFDPHLLAIADRTFLVRFPASTPLCTPLLRPTLCIFLLAILVVHWAENPPAVRMARPAVAQGGFLRGGRAKERSSLNNLFLTTACATVFRRNALTRLRLEAVTERRISVGAPFLFDLRARVRVRCGRISIWAVARMGSLAISWVSAQRLSGRFPVRADLLAASSRWKG